MVRSFLSKKLRKLCSVSDHPANKTPSILPVTLSVLSKFRPLRNGLSSVKMLLPELLKIKKRKPKSYQLILALPLFGSSNHPDEVDSKVVLPTAWLKQQDYLWRFRSAKPKGN